MLRLRGKRNVYKKFTQQVYVVKTDFQGRKVIVPVKCKIELKRITQHESQMSES
jgi:hypothetical protein